MAKKPEKGKARISVTVDKSLLKWLEGEVESKRFGTKSHGVEVALNALKKKIEDGEKIDYE